MGLWSRLFGGKRDAAAEGATITYRVGINETCRSLARRFYGDERQWERVFRDNELALRDEVQTGSDALLPGTEVTVRGARFDLSGQPTGPDGGRRAPGL